MKKRFTTIIVLLACGMLLGGGVNIPFTVMASDVKASGVNYNVSYEGATDIFLCNKNTIGSDVGTEVYLTYTVDKVDSCEAVTQGVIATGKPETFFPYETGIMNYINQKQLLEEGYTYFFKFRVTEAGFEHIIIKAKGKKSAYLKMSYTIGEKTDPLEYFGLWLGSGSVKAQLKNVRCYDRDGNDLGIKLSHSNGASCAKEVSFRKNTKLNHSYTITIKDQNTVALCSMKKPTSDTVYMEYTVKTSDSHIVQPGVILTQDPTSLFPYDDGDGYMLYENMKKKGNGSLLVEGADYIICMKKTSQNVDVTVQRTYKGKKTVFSFPTSAGQYDKKFPYFGIWLGEGTNSPVDCVLTNFKCYDSNNNNLGVQCNTLFTAEHFGEIEDYTDCEAVYYCEQDASMIVLYADKKMVYLENGVKESGTYHISDSEDKVITLSYKEGKEVYSYLYKQITSTEGKIYKRLGTYKVFFVTGSDSRIEAQILSAETGYVVKKPEVPTKEGASFQCWVTRNGKEFDFDSYVTESVTLYAKWIDGEGRETIAISDEKRPIDYAPYISIAVGSIILAISVTGSILFARKGGRRYEKK